MQDRVVDWLLGVDASVRWQLMRDLLDSPESEWHGVRATVETEGWGARLLSHQDDDGQWAGGGFVPRDFDWSQMRTVGQPWTATTWALTQLRQFGLDPASDRGQRTVALVGANARWEHDGQPYWDGEVEECINGRTVADGAYFGVDVSPIVERLLGEQMADGGWNCERENGSVRSSFDSTINVLEGLLEFERATGGTPASRAARAAGEEYLLKRRLFRRLSTGEIADARFLEPVYPNRWHYDMLRALDHFRAAAPLTGATPDPRLGEAVARIRAARRADGTWASTRRLPGRTWFDLDDEPGEPSPWITLHALRVLRWWDSAAAPEQVPLETKELRDGHRVDRRAVAGRAGLG